METITKSFQLRNKKVLELDMYNII